MRDRKNSEAANFFKLIIDPTVSEFLNDPQSVRRGLLAAIVLNHFADYLAMEVEKPVDSVREQLTNQCPAYSLIRDVADASKHAKLSRKKVSLTSWQQVKISSGVFEAPFGEGLFTEAIVVFVRLNDEKEIELRPAIESVMLRLKEFIGHNN